MGPSVCGYLFVYKISLDLLNQFVPNSHGKRIWYLDRTSLNVKVTRSKKAFSGPFGGLRAVRVW